MAPVIEALRRLQDRFEVVICVTAQHREMLDQVHELFGIRPDVDLDLMRPEQELNDLAARSIAGLDGVLGAVGPDWLLAQGDTTTAKAGALAAFHRQVRVGHVEAGLRSGDLGQPFPEEANRRIIDIVADALFVPTALAGERLLAEGAPPARIYVTGNTVVDALQHVAAAMSAEQPTNEVLVTVHRRESFGEPLERILAALRQAAIEFPSARFVLPVHPNPRVSGPVHRTLGGLANVELTPPLNYRDLVRLLRRCRLVLTDSGGLQEEAPAFGKPVLVLREKTERPEGIAAGVATLVGTDPLRILAAARRFLDQPLGTEEAARATNPYGDGKAAQRIAAILAGRAWQPFRGGDPF